MTPGDAIDCATLHCRLAASSCIDRQAARWRPGGGAIVYLPCGNGTCAQGNAVRSALPDYEPRRFSEWRNPKVLTAQRKARAKWLVTRTPYQLSVDDPPNGGLVVGAQGARVEVRMRIAVRAVSVVRAVKKPAPPPARICVGPADGVPCPKQQPLRDSQSRGERCFRCRVAAGETVKGGTRGAVNPAGALGLPPPAELPDKYLRACVLEGLRRLLEHGT